MDLLEKMATFVRVVEAGSLSAAAKHLGLSAAAVSRQIATLEEQVRVTLLLRTTRRMTITDAGHRYYDHCQRILREVEDAQAVGRTGEVRGTLTVSAPVTFGGSRVAPYLPALLAEHPELRIDLRLEDRVVDLVGEAVDVAVRVGMKPPESGGVVAHKLTSYRRVLVAAPKYLARRGEPRTPDDLAKHEAVSQTRDSGARCTWTLRRDGDERTVQSEVRLRSNAVYALREAALQGVGLALLPEWMVADDVERGSLRQVLPRWELDGVGVNALHRVEVREAPRVRVFLEHLRDAYKDGAFRLRAATR